MEKEVIQKPNAPTNIPEYKTIGKPPIDQPTRGIPKHLLPTKRLATILGLVFFAVIAFALIQLPYGEIIKGNFEIKIGYPLPFLDFGIDTAETLPVKPLNLTIDLIIYLIISYIIDVVLGLMLSANKTRIRKQEGKGPKVYEAEN